MSAQRNRLQAKASTQKRLTHGSSSAIVVPTVRSFRQWSPAQLRAAELSADGGNIRLAVDLCDWLLGDDKIRGSLDGRINGLFGLPLSFNAVGDRRRQSRPMKALEAGEDWDAMFPEPEAVQINYWALLLGIGPFINRWAVRDDHGDRDIPAVEFFHPQPLRYDWLNRAWMCRADGLVETPVVFGDGVWGAHMPFGNYRPWLLGMWRSLSRWVLLKQYAISDWGRLGEVATRNVVEVDPVDDASEKRQELANDLANMGRDGSIVMPPGYHFKLVEASAATKELFQSQISMADNAIAIAIRGGNLTTDVKGGSRSAAEVQERTGDGANRRRDASAWEDTAHEQVLVYWASSNYGDAALAPWPEYDTEPEEDRKEKADVFLQAMAGAKAAEDLGFELDRDAFAENFGFSDFIKAGAPKPAPEPVAPVAPTEDAAAAAAPVPVPGKAAAPAKATAQATIQALADSSPHDGQEYTDRVCSSIAEHGAKALAPTVAAMMTAVAKAGSYTEARDLVVAAYGKIRSPVELAQLTEASMVMAQLGGCAEIQESVPEHRKGA